MPPLRSRKEQWLLALLTLRHDRETNREWLATTLWPDNDESQALFYLRKALFGVRTALGRESSRIQSPAPRTITLDLSEAFADVRAFDEAIDADRFSEAAELYRGTLLPGCQEEWACLERASREQAYLAALEHLAAAETDPAAATKWLRLLVVGDPYRESAYRSLMQSLSDSGDRAAVTVVYRELHERLHNDLNTDPSHESVALYQRLCGRETVSVLVPVARPTPSRRHLPVPLTELIGRTREIEEVLGLITNRRMVTLVGSGGVGKTRLAIAVGEAVLSQFQDGVWFVDFSPLAEPNMAAQITANALGIAEEHGISIVATLSNVLVPRSTLVILDNCEHLVEECAELAQTLLENCPGLAILATSRQPLQVDGEQIFRVPSLAVPTPREVQASEGDARELLGFEAVRLFVDRATRAESTFRLTSKNAADVAGICGDLDGIALAIEMAAARLRSMSVVEIRSRLSDRFRLLKSGNRIALPRHHTLRATIDWSYDQLSEVERQALCESSVFAGGWTVEAAEAVACDRLEEREENLDSLVDKSLAVVETRDGQRHYRLLETVRQYAAYRLEESGKTACHRDRHLGYFCKLAETAEPHLNGPDQSHWLELLEGEHDNLRSALSWSIQGGGDLSAGLRICGSLFYFWAIRGHVWEARAWCNEAIQASLGETVEQPALAMANHSMGLVAYEQGDYQIAHEYMSRAVAIWEVVGDQPRLAWSLNGVGIIAKEMGNYDVALTSLERSLEIRREFDDPWSLTQSLGNLGSLAMAKGDHAVAKVLLEEAVAIRRRAGLKRGTAIMLGALGEALMDQGELHEAGAALQESLALRREIGDQSGVAESLVTLSRVASEEGDYGFVKAFCSEGIGIALALGRKLYAAQFFSSFANVAVAERQHLLAARLWGASESLRESYHGVESAGSQARLKRRVESARNSLGDDSAFDAAWDGGRGMSLEQVSALVDFSFKVHL